MTKTHASGHKNRSVTSIGVKVGYYMYVTMFITCSKFQVSGPQSANSGRKDGLEGALCRKLP